MIGHITLKSLKNRSVTAILCILSVAMSVTLILSVEKLRQGARDGFTNSISKTDLIVGARSGPLQLLLYSIFHIGSPTNNIRYSSYEKIKSNPSVGWTIPISLGDSYKGHRVVGTNEDFFTYYHFRGDKKLKLAQGEIFKQINDVVIGSRVAKRLGLKLGDKIFLNHGLEEADHLKHDNIPFLIKGILEPTSTPVDKGVYAPLEGIEIIHEGWETGIPTEKTKFELSQLNKEQHRPQQITAFMLGARSRIFVLRIQHALRSFSDEPLMGIIPALTLQELWGTLAQVENILFVIAIFVLIISLLGIFITLYSSLNERRREMAILRSLGASKTQIFGLLLSESQLLVFTGTILGLGVFYALILALSPWVESNYSVYLEVAAPGNKELLILLLVNLSAPLAGLLPALKAYKNGLQDGLQIKV